MIVGAKLHAFMQIFVIQHVGEFSRFVDSFYFRIHYKEIEPIQDTIIFGGLSRTAPNMYKKQMGMSPSEYRNQAVGKQDLTKNDNKI